MNEEERRQVDIKSYISYFRKFHIFLGISFLLIGLFLFYVIHENAAGIFVGIYPILAYIYFIITGSKYSKQHVKKTTRNGAVIVLGFTFLFVVVLFIYGLNENKLFLNESKIRISGMYGETINHGDIVAVELIDSMPKIKFKSNGFAIGEIHKGYFKTNEGERVKLILNSNQKPLIVFYKLNGEKLFFSSKGEENKNIIDEINSILKK